MNFQMNLSRFLALMALCTIVVFSSCKKDDDEVVVDKTIFIGSYDTAESCGAGYEDNYVMTVADDTAEDDGIIITNIFGSNVTTKATIDGNNLTIADQEFETYGGVTSNIEGSGSVADSIMTINFTFKLAGTTAALNTCTLTCTKQ